MRESSTSWLLLRAVLAVMILANIANADCSAANSTACGVGLCQGFVIINGACTSSCSSGSYYQNTTAMCVSCASLSQSTCSLYCPNFFYAPAIVNNATNSTNSTNSTNGNGGNICQACSGPYGPGCIACNASICTQCATGLQLTSNGQGCVDARCNISKCIQCSGNAGCYLCEPGYQVSQSGNSCVAANCSVSYCSRCSGSNCAACISGYKLANLICQPICDLRCNNCISPGICGGCQSGYALNTNTYSCALNCSVAFSGLCASCTSLLYCSTCKDGYIPALGGAICSPIYSCTDKHCSICSIASVCTVCNTGYYLDTGKCKRDICYIPYCTSCASAKKCSSCSNNFVLNAFNTSCVPACINNVSNCLYCNSSSTCQACNFGFNLVSNQCVPICNISNCVLCLSSDSCIICNDGYLPSDDLSTCDIICNDPYCSVCSNATSCTTCVQGYSVVNGKCCPSCRQGQAMNLNSVCQQCKVSLSNCQACTFDSSNNIACTLCTPGYYLASGSCFACSSAITNCKLCSSPTTCTQCKSGCSLSSSVCVIRNCTAKNCLICKTGSTTQCDTCASGFSVDSSFRCQVSCSAGQVLSNGVCSCPLGTYSQSSSTCTPCADSNCLVCTINSCTSCLQGHYPSGSSCPSCMSNCISCSSAANCHSCRRPYVYYNGACRILGSGFCGGVSSSGAIFTCDPGCSACGETPNGVQVCLTFANGYSQVGGSTIKCDTSCKTCNGPTSGDCLSCFAGTSLNGGLCTACTDPNALTCSETDASFSLTCTRGYTAVMNLTSSPSTSTCQLCAGNCYRCDVNGAGTCDSGQCQVGYVQQSGLTNCTQCFGGCPSCDPNNLMSCLSCGPRRYTDTSGNCAGCPSGCQNCNNGSYCTSCFPRYVMVGTLCQAGPAWPCVAASNDICTQCVQSYSIANGACVYNSDCSKNATCTSCPFGYYLTNVTNSLGICAACPNITNCRACNPLNSSACFLCNDGFYTTSTGTCNACTTGCVDCASATYCNQADSGYFLSISGDGSYSGQVDTCQYPCLTCDVNANLCLSCVSGYSISGSSCFSNKLATCTMVFNLPIVFGKNDSFDVAYGKVLNNMGYFRTTMCANMPKKVRNLDNTCRRNFRFKLFRAGSLGTIYQIDTSPYDSSSEAATEIQNAFLLPDAEVLSSSVSVSGGDTSPGSSTNLGLILGVSIPLGLLLLIIIGIIIYSKSAESKEKYADGEVDDSGKPIEYDNVDYSNNKGKRPRDETGKPMRDGHLEEHVGQL